MTTPDMTTDDLAAAIGPLLDRVGATVVTGPVREDDVAVGLPDGPLLHVRLPSTTHVGVITSPADETAAATEGEPASLSDGLSQLIAEVERELGGSLVELPRAGKQRAVRLLEERGAFEMRRAAETVAQALGVTRFTVYNYLNRGPRGSREQPADATSA